MRDLRTIAIDVPGDSLNAMKETIVRIGQGIRAASHYLPIRNHAARLAARAKPKDYIGQLKNIYDDFLSRWRYVKDPVSIELVTWAPQAVWKLILAGDGRGLGDGIGAGDCDCATVAIGGLLESVGFPVRIATTAPINAAPGHVMTHVFAQAKVPKIGWLTVDPVLHPSRGFGAITNYSRIAFWNLDGQLLGFSGNVKGGFERKFGFGGNDMFPNIERYEDQGMFGLAGDDYGDVIDWSNIGLSGWGKYVPSMGMIDGYYLGGLSVEVDDDDIDYGGGTVRTPMLELAPDDYQYIVANRVPYEGMLGLGDDGQVYQYDGLSGFFKKLFRRVKKGIKKVGRRIKKGIKKVLKKSKFGRFLLKVGSKIKKIAMKIVKPLIKFVGKYAAKLAPVAALIPGFGPAVAAGLYTAGKVANLMRKHMVSLKGKKGKVRGLKFKDPRKLGAFKKDLERAAAIQKKKLKQRGKRRRR